MPPFPERESTILAKLKKKGASAVVEKGGQEKPVTEAAPPGASNGPVTIAQLAAGGEQRAAEGSLISVVAPTQPVAHIASGFDGILVDTFAHQQTPTPTPVATRAALPVNGPLTGPTVEESLKGLAYFNRYCNQLVPGQLIQCGPDYGPVSLSGLSVACLSHCRALYLFACLLRYRELK